MKLSLVVPCYNEEANVRLFHDTALAAFKNADYDFEMVFVNDGSRDGTLKELKALHEESDASIRIVSFSRNFGKEAAMYAGLKNAAGDLVCLIDADLQQRPEVVVEMVRLLDEQPELDCVAAFQAQRHESSSLTFFKDTFYKLINKISDTEFVQGASDFRTFRRSVLDAVLSMSEYHRFSKGILSWVGFNTLYIPYQVQDRAAGESKWSFLKLFKYAIDGIVAFTTAPLRLATFLGIGSCAVACLFLLGVLIACIFPTVSLSAGSFIVFLILFIGGIQLICTGIIGEYLSKSYIQSKNRPIYIAREILEPKEKEDKNEG